MVRILTESRPLQQLVVESTGVDKKKPNTRRFKESFCIIQWSTSDPESEQNLKK